jgi:uncharacterized membrane protein YqaE (UPF0057 family)
MKRLLAGLMLFTANGIILSSCSSTSSLSITKRHYRSGYYVDLGGRSRTHVVAINRATLKNGSEPIHAIEVKQVAYVVSKPISVDYAKLNVVNVAKQMMLPKNKEINSVSIEQNEIVRSPPIVNNLQDQSTHAKNVSVPLAVIVICAIFIPPLGVGLMYGVSDWYFWVDLILTILFFLPGMIFALVVVLS